MTEQEEKKNRRIAAATSIGVHAVLFFLFLFVVAWRAPDPPLPEYGIELNFGLDDQGSGEIQPDVPSGSEQPSEDDVNQAKSEQQEEYQPEVSKEVTPKETKPIEQPVVTKLESPVTVKEEKKVETQPAEKQKEPPKEVVKTEIKPKETVTDEKSTSKTTADKTTTDNKEGKNVSHGDDAGKTGDKGDPKGTIDADAMYGKAGGGSGGVGLSMAGWDWLDKPNPPKPTDKDQFSGKVVFDIEIDSEGYIIGIQKIEGSLSFDLEQKCKEEIQRSSLQKNSAGKPAEKTKGKVTFYLSIK